LRRCYAKTRVAVAPHDGPETLSVGAQLAIVVKASMRERGLTIRGPFSLPRNRGHAANHLVRALVRDKHLQSVEKLRPA
jgi:hypothetical protein